MKKLILILMLIFALWGYAEAAKLEANFLKKKDTLIEALTKAQIDDAHALFSDEDCNCIRRSLNGARMVGDGK